MTSQEGRSFPLNDDQSVCWWEEALSEIRDGQLAPSLWCHLAAENIKGQLPEDRITESL